MTDRICLCCHAATASDLKNTCKSCEEALLGKSSPYGTKEEMKTKPNDKDEWLTEIADNMRSVSPSLFASANQQVLEFFYKRERWIFEQIRQRLGNELMDLVTEDESI